MNQPVRTALLLGGVAVCSLLLPVLLHAQNDKPIRVGFSIAQTGPLSAAGKSGLLALQIWRDDVNARGGLLGRPVELVVYDDQGNAALTPGIYTKLLDVDKVDLLVAPYATNPTASIMPLVKRRDLLLIGNFALDANARIRHDKYFNNQPWASARTRLRPSSTCAASCGANTIAILAADAEFSQNLAGGVRAGLKQHGLEPVYDQNYPPGTVDFSSMVRAIRAKQPDAVFVASYPADSTAVIRAVNEIGVGDSVKLLGRRDGRPAVLDDHAGPGLAVERGGELQRLGAREDDGLPWQCATSSRATRPKPDRRTWTPWGSTCLRSTTRSARSWPRR